jgi:transcriptional regulator with XRE-family HTH domain
MVSFQALQQHLLDAVRARVQNGDITERGLAKLAGLSQPHVHNILKGVRIPSLAVSDVLLRKLHISIADLLNCGDKTSELAATFTDADEYSYVNVLEGLIGPGHPWPLRVNTVERFPISKNRLARFVHPVIGRLAGDIRMEPLFGENDLAIFDQDYRKRASIHSDGLYLIKLGRYGMIRHVRVDGASLYLVAEDCIKYPAAWERISLHASEIQHSVRAQVTFVTREAEWD